MKLKFIFSLTFLLAAFMVNGQEGLEANLEYSKKVNFDFSEEWQYLSTDIYLLNGDKFKDVVNQLSKKRRKENLEFLFVSLKLKSVRFFDKEDIIYPIYNFKLEETRGGVYNAHISDNINVIRVIDKLPLASDESKIDAEITIKAIANDKTSEIMQMVAKQLTGIAKIANPTSAVLSLVGEYGNLIESSTSKREYKFSSTIRLYEEQNFNMKLHSVRLYILKPSNVKVKLPDMTKFSEFIDKTDQPEISKNQIKKLINYKDYPYLLIVNYKSLYKMKGVTGEEITAETIDKRRQRIEKDYNLKLIKDEPYKHEKLFIEFLKQFNNLKKNLNLYKLNYEIRNTEAIKKNLFAIVQSFNTLKITHLDRLKKYNSNSTFLKLFKSEYESIFSNAELYLEKDPNLSNVKDLVNTLYELNHLRVSSLKHSQREDFLERLHAVDLPEKDFVSSYAEGELILKYIKQLEQTHYNEEFASEISTLNRTKATPANLDFRNKLMDKTKQTNCKSCREKAIAAISEFNNRYEKFKIQKTIHKKDSIIQIAELKLIDFFKKKDCITKNINDPKKLKDLGSSKDFILKKWEIAVGKIDRLNVKTTERIVFNTEDEVNNFVLDVENLIDSINKNIDVVCKFEILCDCTPPKEIKDTEEHNHNKE